MWKMACWGYSFIASKSDDAEAEQLASNPFYKLEHDLQDKKKAEEALPVIFIRPSYDGRYDDTLEQDP